MSTHTGRLIHLIVSLAVVAVLAAPGVAAAQEWKIYLVGRTDPIVANFYAEEAPWVFYREDQSIYLFALGCNRVRRVERGGTAIPPPACPVERVPTTSTRVYVSLMELEGKRLDDALTKLRQLVTSYNRALADATISLTGAKATEGTLSVEGLGETQRSLKLQIDEATLDVGISLANFQALTEAIAAARQVEREQLARQRYFFAPR